MKFALVIPTLNASSSGIWEYVLRSYDFQSVQPASRWIIDSSSTDRTVDAAASRNWNVLSIKREEFNHGKIRQQAVDMLAAEGVDVVIFATQDAVLESPETLSNLLKNLCDTGAAVAYARQIPFNNKSADGSARLRNYPEQSGVRTMADVPRLGLMAAFCSNTLAAWRIADVQAAGGFPVTTFGEDMLLAAALLKLGKKISYCAESRCYHSHKDTISEFWQRGVEIGALHRKHSWLALEFGIPERGAMRQLNLWKLPLQIIKYIGFLRGRYCSK